MHNPTGGNRQPEFVERLTEADTLLTLYDSGRLSLPALKCSL
jgi:hypothetical protein